MPNLDYYIDMAKKVRTANKGSNDMIKEIRRMLACDYENPTELQKLEWIGERKFVSTAPADAADAATRSFAARAPNISIQPLTSSLDEYARAERIESALKWEFQRMNKRLLKQSPHWKVVKSAMQFCKVCIQVEYLPFTFKDDKSIRAKNLLRQSKFMWHVHDADTAWPVEGPYGQEAAVKIQKYSAEYLIALHGRDNKGVRKLLADIDEGDGDYGDRLKRKYTYYDITDWKNRVQFAGENDEATYVFMNEEHKMPFINWVIVDNEDPILKSVVNAGLWDNANAINTIIFSKAIQLAADPSMVIATTSGDLSGVSKDESNPSQPIVTDNNTRVTELRGRQIDQQMAQIKQMADSDIFRSSVAQVLASIETIGKQSTFSTVNAMLQAALTQLYLAQDAAERAEAMAFTKMLEWIDYTDIPYVAYRPISKSVGEKDYKKGQQILITGSNYEGDDQPNISVFDLDFLYLDVKLQPKSITDKQAEITNEINIHERLGGSKQQAFERLDLGDYSIEEARRNEETLLEAEIAAEAQRMQAQVQVDTQKQIMLLQTQITQMMQAQQMQQQAALAAANGGPPSNGGPPTQAGGNANLQARGNGQFAGAQGFDIRSGENPPAGAAPGRGREQLTGQTADGEVLA